MQISLSLLFEIASCLLDKSRGLFIITVELAISKPVE
jgi:hypothetical protein